MRESQETCKYERIYNLQFYTRWLRQLSMGRARTVADRPCGASAAVAIRSSFRSTAAVTTGVAVDVYLWSVPKPLNRKTSNLETSVTSLWMSAYLG